MAAKAKVYQFLSVYSGYGTEVCWLVFIRVQKNILAPPDQTKGLEWFCSKSILTMLIKFIESVRSESLQQEVKPCFL